MTNGSTYKNAGVDTEQQKRVMRGVRQWIEGTFSFGQPPVSLPLGYFANVIDIGNGVGIAVSTDGAGTKIIVAQMMNKYDATELIALP